MPKKVTSPPPALHHGVLYRMGQCVTQAYHSPRDEVIDMGKALEKALRSAGLGVYEL